MQKSMRNYYIFLIYARGMCIFMRFVAFFLPLVAGDEEDDPGEEGRDEEGEQRPAQGITMPVHRHAIRDMNADEIDKQQRQEAAKND